MLHFAKNIKYLRKTRKLTQDGASKVLGLMRTTYANYENAGSEPDFDTLLNISSFFGVSVDDMLTKNLEMETYLQKKESGSTNLKINSKNHKTKDYEMNDDMHSLLADRQETAIWYLLKEVKEIRQEIDLLKKSVRVKSR